MGQRDGFQAGLRWTLFGTEFGWAAVEQCDHGITRTRMGYRSKADLTASLPPSAGWTTEVDALSQRIQDYFAGAREEFDDVPLAATWRTPFQRAVINSLRKLGYGQTTSYGELAKRAGYAGAARAVGQVMATNPVPLLVPCHRVLASGGGLGGFSAPTGTTLKQRLLDLEAKTLREAGHAVRTRSLAGAAR